MLKVVQKKLEIFVEALVVWVVEALHYTPKQLKIWVIDSGATLPPQAAVGEP